MGRTVIARRALVSVLNNVLGAALGLVGLNFVTAYGGKVPWGEWVYAFSIVGIPAFLVSLGFPSAHVKRISQGDDEAASNATYLWIKLALTAGFAIFVAAAVATWTRILHRPLTNLTESLLVLALVYYVLLSLRQFFDASFQAHRMAATYESVLMVDTILTTLGVMTAGLVVARLAGGSVPFPGWADRAIDALGLAGPPDANTAALYIGAGYVGGKAISLVYSGLQFLQHRLPIGRPRWSVMRSYTRFAIPVAIIGVLATLIAQIDRAYIGYFYEAPQVADYSLAFQLLNPMLILATSLGLLLFPTLSSLKPHRDRAEVERVVGHADRYLSMLLIPQAMLALVFTPEAVRVVTSSQQYDAAIPILRLLTIFIFLTSLLTSTRSLVLGADQPQLLARLGKINLALVAVLNLVFIPPSGAFFGLPALGWGGVGAAVVAVLTALVSYLYLRSQGRAWARVGWLPPDFARQAAAGLLCGVGLWWAKTDLITAPARHVHELAAWGLAGLAAYGLVLFLLGGLTRRDAKFFRDLLHPGKLASYLGGELAGKRSG